MYGCRWKAMEVEPTRKQSDLQLTINWLDCLNRHFNIYTSYGHSGTL